MDYKEKYEQGLECIQEILCGAGDSIKTSILRKRLQPFFPELEDEDERIKREILEYINSYANLKDEKIPTEWLAWLEKQCQAKESIISQHEIEICKENDNFLTGEDERIKETLKEFVKGYSAFINGQWRLGDFTVNRLIAWLEKQGIQPTDKIEPKFKPGDTMRTWREAANGYTDGMPVVVSIDNEYYHCTNELIAIKDQDDYEFPPINVKKNPADNVEPKFHPGDWIIDNEYGEVLKVTKADANSYEITSQDGEVFNILKEDVEYNHRIWTIQDAKDGDVLVDVYGNIGIFKKCYDFDWMSYCSLGNNGGFQVFTVEHENEKTYPTSKEQRDLFFSKMKEEGWEWDSENKELIKNL